MMGDPSRVNVEEVWVDLGGFVHRRPRFSSTAATTRSSRAYIQLEPRVAAADAAQCSG